MHHPVCACREKDQEPVQLHWLERSLGILWEKLKDACTVCYSYLVIAPIKLGMISATSLGQVSKGWG